ncbi:MULTISPECIES: hypothetical protein [Pseudonocardia]|uniref:Uncharacterized protein n=2 Tax=Pseudonocardia TaxID=1847 RepID=A0A1Y2MM40_PSEAH|nr:MULTISPECIES: hypothetical protein [Pseudonocardia]OSY36334.1 hypothetical protein BG845_05411 [Pseudonocardia autotrophica]TDN72708.1 hypothetical protein C8E95_1769 [Pseudonocardia autotrophica]BBG03421.1 hypothetical protein Pdca_46300 [Pseudonocardia autotrophica]GEC27224.1 hypothetical protein PSA01_42530 [Pseudonocardia saturnea]
MADNASSLSPVLHYDDTETALRFLVDVVGFREAVIVRDDGGDVVPPNFGGRVVARSSSAGQNMLTGSTPAFELPRCTSSPMMWTPCMSEYDRQAGRSFSHHT